MPSNNIIIMSSILCSRTGVVGEEQAGRRWRCFLSDRMCRPCLSSVFTYCKYVWLWLWLCISYHIISYHIILFHIISHHIISYHNIRVQRAKIGSRGFHPNQWQSFAQVMRYDTIRYNIWEDKVRLCNKIKYEKIRSDAEKQKRRDKTTQIRLAKIR